MWTQRTKLAACFSWNETIETCCFLPNWLWKKCPTQFRTNPQKAGDPKEICWSWIGLKRKAQMVMHSFPASSVVDCALLPFAPLLPQPLEFVKCSSTCALRIRVLLHHVLGPSKQSMFNFGACQNFHSSSEQWGFSMCPKLTSQNWVFHPPWKPMWRQSSRKSKEFTTAVKQCNFPNGCLNAQ